MSRLKSVSTSNAQSTGLTSSSSVSSAGQAGIFNDLFDAMAVDQAAAQEQAGADAGGQQGQGGEQSQTKEIKEAKDPNDVSKSEEGASAKPKAKASSEEDEEELSVEERREIEEAEQHRICIEELARQLNVALNAPAQSHAQAAMGAQIAQAHANPQAAVHAAGHPFAQVKVVVKETVSDVRDALQGIDPKLLRKVDAQALDAQLRKLMGGDHLLDVRPPGPVADPAADAPALQVISPDELMRSEINGLESQIEDSRAELETTVGDEFQATDRVLAAESGNFADIMSDISSKNRFRMDEIGSEKSYVADQMAQSASRPFEHPQRVENLSLGPTNAIAALAQAGGQNARFSAPAASRPHPRLESADLAKINLKVESVILGSAKGEGGTTRIQMNPEELGRIDIHIEIKDKGVKAEIITDNAQARESILSHLPQIKAVLASENLMLDYFNARHDDRHFAQPEQQRGGAETGFGLGQDGQKDDAGHDRSATARELREVIRNRIADKSIINITV